MTDISVAGKTLSVKDYDCAGAGDGFSELPGEDYYPVSRPALWLYVNVTDRCNASCPFCVSAAGPHNSGVIDPVKLQAAARAALPHIRGVSFTGGEPMLYPDVLDEAAARLSEILPDECEMDLATNGTRLEKLPDLACFGRISSIHLSRHFADDSTNRELMGGPVPSAAEIREFITGLPDPGKIVLNCVLQKGFVDDISKVAEYLDFAISAGVRNTSFITMFCANGYCASHMISAVSFPVVTDSECEEWNRKHPDSAFKVWNRHMDHDFCRCMSGTYRNASGLTRFYFRCPGTGSAPPYCRQLVYTADDRLQDGFGKDRTVIWE